MDRNLHVIINAAIFVENMDGCGRRLKTPQMNAHNLMRQLHLVDATGLWMRVIAIQKQLYRDLILHLVRATVDMDNP
jgi:hypothetical protein